MRLEYLVNCHVLASALPPVGFGTSPRVLDAGGGPGRYTILLAERGYRVSLLDLSPKLLALAGRRITELPHETQSRVERVMEGSIADLSMIADASFDVVICLGGPLGYLTVTDHRARALAELRRVAKPGAPLLLTAFNRFGAYRGAVQWWLAQNTFDSTFPSIAETGMTVQELGAPAYAYASPDEFQEEIEAAGIEFVRMVGCMGIGAHLQEEHLRALMADALRWPQWQKVFLESCEHPSIAGASTIILAVARRPG